MDICLSIVRYASLEFKIVLSVLNVNSAIVHIIENWFAQACAERTNKSPKMYKMCQTKHTKFFFFKLVGNKNIH